jgi:hypothetical protein
MKLKESEIFAEECDKAHNAACMYSSDYRLPLVTSKIRDEATENRLRNEAEFTHHLQMLSKRMGHQVNCIMYTGLFFEDTFLFKGRLH